MGLIERTKLTENPFEHYAAETEPRITEYAVRPPYLTAISKRAWALGSFVLFGDRGSGKSATRITIFNELWRDPGSSTNKKSPLTVNLVDYTHVLSKFKKGQLSDRDLVGLVAFYIIEQVLVWLSSLPEDEREIYIEALDLDEKALALALIEAFYAPIPEMDREVSTREALRLLKSAWHTKSQVWISARWTALSRIASAALAALSRKHLSADVDISDAAEDVLKSLKSTAPNASRAIMSKLAELAQAFGFSGVCVLIDKVDETPETSNSAEATAKLVHPIMEHVQLLEVQDFAWVFFLWSNVQNHFQEKLPVRLDKITHANINWDQAGLREMIEKRLFFFSNGVESLRTLFDGSLNVEEVFQELCDLTLMSPRELIRLLDVVIREHDARGALDLLDRLSLDIGMDKYVVETIGTWYPENILQPVLRLGQESFVNKNVQTKFRISDQGARVRIKNWEEAGLVKQEGTLPSELGGKQVHRYEISDPRVKRIIERRLIDIVGADLDDSKQDTSTD